MTKRYALPLLLLGAALGAAGVRAETHAVDPERSTMTVQVHKSGLLSAFGDDHVVRAPIASGSAEDGEKARVEIEVDARRMTVLDPGLKPEKRAEVQKRMLGPDVLDVARFPTIRFHSTSVKTLAPGRWRVEGSLELHGQTKPLSFEVTGANGRLHGSVPLRQSAFGIEPISVGGGTVKVKDVLEVVFEIATRDPKR